MEIDNETNDPIDYEQTGSGGGAEEEAPGPPCPRTGRAAAHSNARFVPCGSPPFHVELSTDGGETCSVGGITSRRASLIVHDMETCDVTVEEDG